MENLIQYKQQLRDAEILLIENDSINQMLIMELLELIDAKVTCADNSETALKKIALEKYDLVIMNIHMPNMNGYETSRQIRQVLQLTQLPIIVLTANNATETQRHYLDAGINDFLSKPVNPEQLYATLVKWIPTSISRANTCTKENVEKNKTSPIDIDVIKKLLGEDTEVINKFILKYIEVSEQIISELKAAKVNNNIKSMGEKGHKLRSSARSMGAYHFAELCSSLEQAGKEENLQLAEMLCDEIFQSFETIKHQLENEFIKP